MNNSNAFIILKYLISLLPNLYRKEPDFSTCVMLVENLEAQSVEKLIALTQVEGHYFSDDFWKELSKCAVALELPSQVLYCNQQLERNKAFEHQIPLGWTMVKVERSKYVSYAAQSLIDKWSEERRHRHNVHQFICYRTNCG